MSPGLALLAGTASGFTTFVAHAGGPPVAMYLLGRGLPKNLLVGTTIALFTLGNWLKLPPYILLGLKNQQALWSALALAPAVPLGIWLGRIVHDRLDQKTLFLWCYGLLFVAATEADGRFATGAAGVSVTPACAGRMGSPCLRPVARRTLPLWPVA